MLKPEGGATWKRLLVELIAGSLLLMLGTIVFCESGFYNIGMPYYSFRGTFDIHWHVK